MSFDPDMEAFEREYPKVRGFSIFEAGGIPSRQYGEGRRCDMCRTKLSRYNPGPNCYPCEEKRTRGH